MAYTYPTQFPQPSRARIEAVKIQAGLHLDDSKQHERSLADLESEVRQYILRIFDAFAAEVLALGQRGVWSVERIDREASEFLGSITLEAQFRKGHDRQGHSISPLVDRVFGQILPEVRREFEQSSQWRRYQEGLLNVAHAQASGAATEASAGKAPDGANTEARPSVPSDGETSPARGMRKLRASRPYAWEAVEIAFLSDERIQVWIDGRPETYNYAEFGCVDQRSERPNKAWQMLLLLAKAGGVIPATARSMTPDWPAIEKQVERLRAVLQRNFNLDEDPLPFETGAGYRVRFKIRLAESFDK